MRLNTFDVESYSVTSHNGTVYIKMDTAYTFASLELTEEERKNLIQQLRQLTDEIK